MNTSIREQLTEAEKLLVEAESVLTDYIEGDYNDPTAQKIDKYFMKHYNVRAYKKWSEFFESKEFNGIIRKLIQEEIKKALEQ